MGEVELARLRLALSRLRLGEVVEEQGRLMVASWSARTSSRRTSESEMRGCASLGSRISTNFEGVSRIVVIVVVGSSSRVEHSRANSFTSERTWSSVKRETDEEDRSSECEVAEESKTKQRVSQLAL